MLRRLVSLLGLGVSLSCGSNLPIRAVAPPDVAPAPSLGQQEPELLPQKESSEKSREPTHSVSVSKRKSLEGGVTSRRGRAGYASRDFALRIGLGFRSSELVILREALEVWSSASGLPLHIREGYGPLGLIHVFEEIPTCGQSSVYEGLLGCYNPETDVIAINRPATRLLAEQMLVEDGNAEPSTVQIEAATERLFYIVLVHELGHWLGLPHSAKGEDSIMLPDLPALSRRFGSPAALADADVRAVRSRNAKEP